MRRHRPWHILLLAFAAAALLGIACRHASGDDDAPPTAPAETTASVPVPIAARVVCSLVASNRAAAAVNVTGADGAQSAVVDGTSTWFFGDTVRTGPGGRKDVIHAAVATSRDTDASDCVDLAFKQAGGQAQPLFPRLAETTAWPDGVLAMDDGSIVFYMVKAVRESPFSWHVASVGLGRVEPGTTTATRVAESIWDEHSGFGSRIAGVRSPVRVGDEVYAYIRTDAGGIYVARAPIERMAEAAAYEYRAGDGWVRSPAEAKPMWPVEQGYVPADNGVQVTRDAASGQWMALYNGELASVQVRTAPDPWGPWSEPQTWFDCRPFVGDRYPYCYSSELHTQYDRDGGRVRYLTMSSQEPYDVSLVEVTMGVAIHEWRGPDDSRRYAAAQPEGFDDGGGVAFWASDEPRDGMVPVYETMTPTGARYSLDAQSDGRPAFYAWPEQPPEGAAIPFRPVYRWRRGDVEVLDASERPGFERGDVAFWAK